MMQPTVKVGQRFKFTVLLTDDALTERQGVVIRVLSNREEGLGLDVDQYMSYWVEREAADFMRLSQGGSDAHGDCGNLTRDMLRGTVRLRHSSQIGSE